ncbi:MAG: MBL fold metallo-hydrolase [Lachnospiraceae bacterium]|nr:MBL fold metallo-hydrolase [Lachnospiraceae bacterium]
MIELVKAGERTYYFTGLFHVGLYLMSYDEVCLIDAGIDREYAREMDELLIMKNWKVRLIINTHYHADHCGGSRYFQDKYKCKIYASGINAALISDYEICPSIVWGAIPLNVLMNNYYYADSCDAEDIRGKELPEGLEVVALPGHAISMIGIKTDDDVLFLGDAVVGEEVIEKEKLTYIYDIGEYLKSLDKLEKIEAKLYVTYHGEPVKDIKELVRLNRKNVVTNLKRVKAICKTPRKFDEIVHEFFNDIDMELTLYKYNVKGGMIKTYLTYLHNTGKMETECIDNYLLWQTIS